MYPSMPYCLDIGVLGNGETALVEMNDAFSIGMYDGMESCYPELLITRWKELTMREEMIFRITEIVYRENTKKKS